MACAAGQSRARDDRVWPYVIHVSTKYLELTRQKLELTRLPHDMPGPASTEWWNPKPVVESLVDFWLERYSWRRRQAELNAAVPQFRAAIQTPAADAPCRMHLIHAPSPRANAVPLLLIPPFPFTNLALAHLVALFTEPDGAADAQTFHLVIPSLPGMGFSHGLSNSAPMIPTVAAMLNALMARLGYRYYLVTNSGPSVPALPHVDWRLANHLVTCFPDSCLGAHFLSPPIGPPTPRHSPWEWAKWSLVRAIRRPMLGYTSQDMEALAKAESPAPDAASTAPPLGFGGPGAYEPNTLAYALCDSPLSLVLLFLMVVRILGPNEEVPPAQLVDLAALTWLPGPEGTMRLWAHCSSSTDDATGCTEPRPRIAVTVFLGDDGSDGTRAGPQGGLACGAAAGLPQRAAHTYVCPAWANRRYRVVATNRVPGRPGLLAWERPWVLTEGVTRLARAILAVDERLASLNGRASMLERMLVAHGHRAALGGAAPSEQTLVALGEPEGPEARVHEAGGGEDSRHGQGRGWPVTPRNRGAVEMAGPGGDGGGRHVDDDGDSETSEGSPSAIIAIQPRPSAA